MGFLENAVSLKPAKQQQSGIISSIASIAAKPEFPNARNVLIF